MARTSVEISANYNVTLSSFSGLAAYYKMDEGTPGGTNTGITSLTDASGNGKTASLSGFTMTGSTSNYIADHSGPIAPANPTSITATVNPICNGTSTVLTANGPVGTVYWYTSSCGGTATSPATSTAADPTLTVSPSVTTTYYARNNNGTWSAGCASVTITVNPVSAGGAAKW